MKQYKLLKDLPTFKKGEVFTLFDNGNLVTENSHDDAGHMVVAYSSTTLKKFPNILTDWFEEITEHHRPTEGEAYYFIESDGRIRPAIWKANPFNFKSYELGNIFKTKEEAKEAVKWLKAFATLRRDTNGYRPKRGKANWYAYYNFYSKKLKIDSDPTNVNSELAFESEVDVWTSVQKHEKEWLTYFGIKEKEDKDETEE